MVIHEAQEDWSLNMNNDDYTVVCIFMMISKLHGIKLKSLIMHIFAVIRERLYACMCSQGYKV